MFLTLRFFSTKGQIIDILGFVDLTVSVVASGSAVVALKQPQTISKQIGTMVFPLVCIYGSSDRLDLNHGLYFFQPLPYNIAGNRRHQNNLSENVTSYTPGRHNKRNQGCCLNETFHCIWGSKSYRRKACRDSQGHNPWRETGALGTGQSQDVGET